MCFSSLTHSTTSATNAAGSCFPGSRDRHDQMASLLSEGRAAEIPGRLLRTTTKVHGMQMSMVSSSALSPALAGPCLATSCRDLVSGSSSNRATRPRVNSISW